mgnify:CR=1 FL=1
MQLKCSGIFSSSFADLLASISQAITVDLTTIAEQIASDVETGISQNYYIKDENGDTLQAAIFEFERCNCSILALSSSKVEKLVRIGGRVLLVVGVIADILEIREAIRADLDDADPKLGKTTLSAIASVGGSWAGAFGGAKIGTLAGAMIGPAAPIAIPVWGIIGGALGALGGELAAEWVVDVTCLKGEYEYALGEKHTGRSV